MPIYASKWIFAPLFDELTLTHDHYLQVMEAALKQLRSGNLSPTDIARGKAQLKAAILLNQESNCTLAEEIGTQAVLLGSVLSGPAIVSAVNSVTDAEVNAVSFLVSCLYCPFVDCYQMVGHLVLLGY